MLNQTRTDTWHHSIAVSNSMLYVATGYKTVLHARVKLARDVHCQAAGKTCVLIRQVKPMGLCLLGHT